MMTETVACVAPPMGSRATAESDWCNSIDATFIAFRFIGSLVRNRRTAPVQCQLTKPVKTQCFQGFSQNSRTAARALRYTRSRRRVVDTPGDCHHRAARLDATADGHPVEVTRLEVAQLCLMLRTFRHSLLFIREFRTPRAKVALLHLKSGPNSGRRRHES